MYKRKRKQIVRKNVKSSGQTPVKRRQTSCHIKLPLRTLLPDKQRFIDKKQTECDRSKRTVRFILEPFIVSNF